MLKNTILLTLTALVLTTACTVTEPVSKLQAYNGLYTEKPVSLLIMPPINRSTNVEAKEYFHTTLNVPIANAGYYVIPPFLSMDILKRESAYDAELFLDAPLAKFGEVFGADMALFTLIHKWDKSSIGATVTVDVEYIIKSIHTNEVLFKRRGQVTYDTSMNLGGSGLVGALANMAASAINTAVTKYVDVARACNSYTLSDLPAGTYSPTYLQDSIQSAGKDVFKVTIKK